jgi:hypothetical protein
MGIYFGKNPFIVLQMTSKARLCQMRSFELEGAFIVHLNIEFGWTKTFFTMAGGTIWVLFFLVGKISIMLVGMTTHTGIVLNGVGQV